MCFTEIVGFAGCSFGVGFCTLGIRIGVFCWWILGFASYLCSRQFNHSALQPLSCASPPCPFFLDQFTISLQISIIAYPNPTESSLPALSPNSKSSDPSSYSTSLPQLAAWNSARISVEPYSFLAVLFTAIPTDSKWFPKQVAPSKQLLLLFQPVFS